MKNVIIVTDSSCDISDEMMAKLPIKVLPMPVSLKDDPEKDISDLASKSFMT